MRFGVGEIKSHCFFVKFTLRFVYTRDLDLAILLSDAISIEILPSFQIATVANSNKHVMFYGLCKHHLTDVNRWTIL